MISPRFSARQLGSDEAAPASQPIAIHLHVPERLAESLLMLVATITGPRSRPLFEEFADTVSQTLNQSPAAPPRPAAPPASTPAEASGQGETTLQAYRRVLKSKRQRSASAGTVGDHEGSMRVFDAFCLSQITEKAGISSDSGSSDETRQTLHRLYTPVQCLGDPDAIRAFVASQIQAGRSPFTVNRRMTHLSMLAKVLKIDFEKPTPDEVRRLWIDFESSQPKKARTHKRAKPKAEACESSEPLPELPDRRIPSFAELDAMAKHVSETKYPYGDHAPYFWRGWIRYLALIGPRSRDIVSPLTRKTGLKKSDCIFETLCPIPDVNNALGRELHSPHGWLWYTIGKDHHSDCRRILIPMPLWLRNWVRFFHEFSHDPVRVFPSCQQRSKSLSQGKLTFAWTSILQAAGVDPRIVPSEGNGDSIAIRKYAANWWQLTTLKTKNDASLADKMSHYVLHHAEVTTANRHYLNVQAAVLPTMLELMPQWPVPAAGAAPVSMLPE